MNKVLKLFGVKQKDAMLSHQNLQNLIKVVQLEHPAK